MIWLASPSQSRRLSLARGALKIAGGVPGIRDMSLKAEAIEKHLLPYTVVQLDRFPASSRQESLSVLEDPAGNGRR